MATSEKYELEHEKVPLAVNSQAGLLLHPNPCFQLEFAGSLIRVMDCDLLEGQDNHLIAEEGVHITALAFRTDGL